jgi:hypothetical protein
MKVMRDLTRAQFQRALAKNSFRQVLMWIEDISGECPGVSWGVIILAGGGKKGPKTGGCPCLMSSMMLSSRR